MSEYVEREAAVKALQEKVFTNYTDEFFGAMQALNCHGCKWLDRYKKDGNGYCCMVAEKIRRPEMERCERYKAGDFKTRWETERAEQEV